jgi:hypothetical protein
MRLMRNYSAFVAEQPGHPLLFCAGPVAASPRRARGVSPLQPRRLGCTPLRSARVPCGTTRANATGHQLALREAQASRAALRHEERDASHGKKSLSWQTWGRVGEMRVRVGRCKRGPARRQDSRIPFPHFTLPPRLGPDRAFTCGVTPGEGRAAASGPEFGMSTTLLQRQLSLP